MNTQQSSDPAVVFAAHWFWWIAGLSLVNTVMYYAGSDDSFAVGLGLTTLASVFLATAPAIAVTVVTLLFYVWVGFEAAKGKAWAFYLGLAVYVADALLFVYFEQWLSVAFHGLPIYFIVKGLMRVNELARK